MKKHSLAVAAAIAASAAIVLSGCSAGGAASTTNTSSSSVGGTLNVGVILVPTQWDPAQFDWTQQLQVQQAAYDTLIHINPNGSFSPGLATSWKYVSPTQFTLTLRHNVKFTDGTPFNAAAVKENLDHDKATTGPRTAQLADVSSVETNGEFGVTINLSQPNSDLPQILGMAMGMMASPAAEAAGKLKAAPVGTGPYTLNTSQTVANDHYTFEKNPNYWDAADIHYKTLVFKLIADYTASVNALRSGQIAMALGEPQTVSTAKSGGDTVVTYPGAVVSLDLQDRGGTVIKALGDVRVRQAINYAIDRAALTKTLLPGRPTSQLFADGTPAYEKSLDGTYSLDLAKAKSLMEQAGFSSGFTLPILSFPLNDPALQVVASDLAKINIKVKIDSVPINTYIALRSTQQTPAWIAQLSSTGSALLDALNVLQPNGLFNPFHSSNPQLTQDLTKAESATSASTEKAAWMKVNMDVQQLAWFAPITQISTYYYYNPKVVAGVQATAGQSVPFIYTWQPAKS